MLRHRIGPTAACATLIVVACVSAAWHTPVGAATAVTACGQVYSGSGMLTADLDCTGLAATAAVQIDGGSLDLQGFTLTGGNLDAVFCTKNCRVFSSAPGGMIRGAGNHTVRGAAPGPNLTVEDISLDANGLGMITFAGRIKGTNLTITDTTGCVMNGARVRLRNVTITNAGDGVVAGVAKITDSAITNAGDGVVGADRAVVKGSTISAGQDGIRSGGPLRVVDSMIVGNAGPGIRTFASRLRVLNSDISGNGEEGIHNPGGPGRMTMKESTVSNNALDGIFYVGRIKIVSSSTVTGNGLHGVNTGPNMFDCENKVRLRDSTVTGNGVDTNCGVTQTCADVAACILPTVATGTCDTSYDTNSGFPGTSWGVCALV